MINAKILIVAKLHDQKYKKKSNQTTNNQIKKKDRRFNGVSFLLKFIILILFHNTYVTKHMVVAFSLLRKTGLSVE